MSKSTNQCGSFGKGREKEVGTQREELCSTVVKRQVLDSESVGTDHDSTTLNQVTFAGFVPQFPGV